MASGVRRWRRGWRCEPAIRCVVLGVNVPGLTLAGMTCLAGAAFDVTEGGASASPVSSMMVSHQDTPNPTHATTLCGAHTLKQGMCHTLKRGTLRRKGRCSVLYCMCTNAVDGPPCIMRQLQSGPERALHSYTMREMPAMVEGRMEASSLAP